MDDTQRTLLTIGTSLLVAIVSSVVTVWLSSRRFRSERWWEKKSDAYSQITQALYRRIQCADEHILWLEEHRERSVSAEQTAEISAAEATRRINEAAIIGAFVISPQAAVLLETLQSELGQAQRSYERDGNPLDWVYADADALKRCLVAFKAAARRDLQV